MTRTFDDYRLRPKAHADLAEIWQYTADTWSLDQADHYISQIINHLEAACQGKHRFRPIPEIEGEYLKITSGSHFIIGRGQGSIFIVVRILHQRQDIEGHTTA